MGVFGKSNSEWSMQPGVIPSQPSKYALGLSGASSCHGCGGDGTLGMGSQVSERVWEEGLHRAGLESLASVALSVGLGLPEASSCAEISRKAPWNLLGLLSCSLGITSLPYFYWTDTAGRAAPDLGGQGGRGHHSCARCEVSLLGSLTLNSAGCGTPTELVTQLSVSSPKPSSVLSISRERRPLGDQGKDSSCCFLLPAVLQSVPLSLQGRLPESVRQGEMSTKE